MAWGHKALTGLYCHKLEQEDGLTALIRKVTISLTLTPCHTHTLPVSFWVHTHKVWKLLNWEKSVTANVKERDPSVTLERKLSALLNISPATLTTPHP